MGAADSYYHGEAEKYFKLAYEKQGRGELEEAIDCYRKSIELFPTAEAHTLLGWAYSFRGSYDEAIQECRKAIEIDPEYGNPYNDIGSYLIEKGDLDLALPWLEKALQARRYDNYCYPHYNMGRIWERKGDWNKAMSSYRQALIENQEYTLARQAWNRLQSLLN